MADPRRWRENRKRNILLLVATGIVIAVVVPVVAYYSTLGNPRRSNTNPNPSSSSSSSSPRNTRTNAPSTQVLTVMSTTTLSETETDSATSAIGSTVPTQDLEQVERDMLERHNVLRALHGAPNMTWNDELTRFAADYAANNFTCDNVQLIHSGGPYGENLAAGYVGGDAPVDAWYDEISLYNYSDPGFSEPTGHFTQLIWNTSLELGCAIVTCDNAWHQYTICEYYPRGNIVGMNEELTQEIFSEHVLPLLSDQ